MVSLKLIITIMYVVGTHKKHLTVGLLMSTHKICFYGEKKRKILCGYPLLSEAVLILGRVARRFYPGIFGNYGIQSVIIELVIL